MFTFAGQTRVALLTVLVTTAMSGATVRCQQTESAAKFPQVGDPTPPKPPELPPNPYRLVEGWPTLSKSMNGVTGER